MRVVGVLDKSEIFEIAYTISRALQDGWIRVGDDHWANPESREVVMWCDLEYEVQDYGCNECNGSGMRIKYSTCGYQKDLLACSCDHGDKYRHWENSNESSSTV